MIPSLQHHAHIKTTVKLLFPIAEHPQLAFLDVSGCKALAHVHAGSAQLQTLGARMCPVLEELALPQASSLRALDIAHCPALVQLTLPALPVALHVLHALGFGAAADHGVAVHTLAGQVEDAGQANALAEAVAAAAARELEAGGIWAPRAVRFGGCDALHKRMMLLLRVLRAAGRVQEQAGLLRSTS